MGNSCLSHLPRGLNLGHFGSLEQLAVLARAVSLTYGSRMELAFAALLISILSLSWNVFNTFFKLPRLHVVTGIHTHVRVGLGSTTEPSGTSYSPTITVINTGGEAATVTDVGLLDTAGAILLSISRDRGDGVEIDGEKLPARIEPHGALS